MTITLVVVQSIIVLLCVGFGYGLGKSHNRDDR